MASNTLCEISFHMRFQTTASESVRIIGNLPDLGNWDPAKGLILQPSLSESSIWVSPQPLKVEKKTKLEFKCIVLEGQSVKRWETFPKDSNRKYKARHMRVILKGTENDDVGKEVIEIEEGIGVPKPEEEKKQAEKQEKNSENGNYGASPHRHCPYQSQGSDLALTESTQINRPNIRSLDPLAGDAESEDSNNSSMQELCLEGSPPRKPILKNLQEKLDEIESKSSESLETDPRNLSTDLPGTLDSRFSMIFKKMKDRFYSRKPKTPKHSFPMLFEDDNESDKIPIETLFNKKYIKEADPMIFVCKFLPITVFREQGTIQAKIIKDSNQFYLSRHLLTGDYKNVLCVGMLRDFIAESDRLEVSQMLRKEYNCLPIFLNHEVKEMFLMSHEIFSMLDSLMNLSDYSKSLTIDKFWGVKHSAWDVLSEINENYCQVLMELKDSQYQHILITDYHLILTPKLLKEAGFEMSIGFYFNANFPTFEVFRLFPFKDDFLGGLISTDIIYFNCFEKARPFFTALQLEKNVKVLSKTGVFYFHYRNKPTFIKLKSVTVDSEAICSLVKKPIPHIKCLNEPGVNIVLGLDRISELTGVDLKMRFFAQWCRETKNKYHAKLLQILQKPYYGPLSEKQRIWLENIRNIEKELNGDCNEREKIIELYEMDPNEQESLYLMSRAKVLVNSSIKNEYCVDSMKFVLATENNGHFLISEFMNYNRSCGSIFSFNPLKYFDFKEKIENLFRMQPQLSKGLIHTDVAYLLKYPISSWFHDCFSDLKSIHLLSKDQNKPKTTENTLGMTLPMFQIHDFAQDYHKSNTRVFIFEFFGSLVRSTPITDLNRFSKKAIRRTYQFNESLLLTLKTLVQDDRNIVYVITSKSANNLDIALGALPEIGLAAESGYVYKLRGKNKWSKLVSIDWSWKEVVRKNMENYTKNTFGSTLEIKESALVWNYADAPSELAEMQSKSLVSHLKNSLEKIRDVEIVVGNNYIEAKPVGISKGAFVSLLLRSYQKISDIDFVMMMGADRDTFSAIREFIRNKGNEENYKKYMIWVGAGKKEGDYLLKSNEEVGELMRQLRESVFS